MVLAKAGGFDWDAGMKRIALALMGFLVVSGCKEKAASGGAAAGDGGGSAVEAADGSVVLALEEDPMPVGAVLEENFRMEIKAGKIVITMPDQEMEGTMSVVETKKAKTEGLAKDKVRVTVLEDQKSETMEMAGQAQPAKVTVDPLEGKSVIAEKGADGVWTAVLEDGEATPEMTEALKKISKKMGDSLGTKIYGTEPRKVGEEWEMTGDDLMGIEGGKGSFTVKFESIEEYKGVRCAKLTGKMDITGNTPEGDGAQQMEVKMSGDFTVFRSLEHRVDLSNELVGTMEVNGEMSPQPGLVMKMKMEGPMEMTGTSVVTGAK